MRTPRTLQQFNDHPWVGKAFRDSDGYWVWLKPGYWSTNMECGTLHEYTVKELIEQWQYVGPRDTAREANSQPTIEQVARDGFRTTRSTSYSEWDAMRRTLFTLVDDYPDVEVVHGENESALYYGGKGGRIVASWETATGTCNVHRPDQIADDIANDVRNYIRHATRYSTDTISEMEYRGS